MMRADEKSHSLWDKWPARRTDGAEVSEPIELVIFDCDGVLVDSERIVIRIDAMILEQLGWSLTEAEIVERFVGRSTESITVDIEAHIGRSLPSDWEDEFESLYRDALARELIPVDGIAEALDAIMLPTCVASSGSHEKMRFTLGLTGLYERFAGRIFSASEVARGKPEPDLFLHAAAQMGVAPAACVVVEDSEPGVRAARAAGMRVFGYAGGVTPAARLEAHATVVFDDMRDLPTLL
jgi:HAD superfamily hydrolase (TIGR01509 family)